jgi:hypothetical protein
MVEIDSRFSGDYPEIELERKLEDKHMNALVMILVSRSCDGGFIMTRVARLV